MSLCNFPSSLIIPQFSFSFSFPPTLPSFTLPTFTLAFTLPCPLD